MGRTLTTERLIEMAEGGDTLATDDRRQCVMYLMSTRPELSNVDLGVMFHVTEAAIRKDKQIIREQMAKEVKEDDVGLVVADIAFNFRRQLRDLEVSKAACTPGSKEYRQHCVSILELELKKTKAFQELGYLPKNLGNLTVDHFEYAAVVLKDGSVDTRPVNMFDDKSQIDIREQLKSGKKVPLGLPEAIDAEFVDVPNEPREVSYADNPSRELSQNLQGAPAARKEGQIG